MTARMIVLCGSLLAMASAQKCSDTTNDVNFAPQPGCGPNQVVHTGHKGTPAWVGNDRIVGGDDAVTPYPWLVSLCRPCACAASVAAPRSSMPQHRCHIRDCALRSNPARRGHTSLSANPGVNVKQIRPGRPTRALPPVPGGVPGTRDSLAHTSTCMCGRPGLIRARSLSLHEPGSPQS